MTKTKVTDLEKFALEQIFWPYQSMTEFGGKRLESLPISIDEIPLFAKNNERWWQCVSARIHRMNVYFPQYIKHPIVDMIRGTHDQG